MLIVSNTSPVMNLAVIGRLPLLEELFQRVLIPDAVAQELATISRHHPGFPVPPLPAYLEQRSVSDHALVVALQGSLDPGEAEAIALAVETRADLLLLDERRGRRMANQLGINVMGLLGMLIDAKRRGLLMAVRPLLDDLVAKAGFWVSRRLYDQVLHAAGE